MLKFCSIGFSLYFFNQIHLIFKISLKFWEILIYTHTYSWVIDAVIPNKIYLGSSFKGSILWPFSILQEFIWHNKNGLSNIIIRVRKFSFLIIYIYIYNNLSYRLKTNRSFHEIELLTIARSNRFTNWSMHFS